MHLYRICEMALIAHHSENEDIYLNILVINLDFLIE